MCPGASKASPAKAQPRPNAWEWSCNVCTFINRPAFGSCEMCGLPRGAPAEPPAAAAGQRGAPSEAGPRQQQQQQHRRQDRAGEASRENPGGHADAVGRPAAPRRRPRPRRGEKGPAEDVGREILALLKPGAREEDEAAKGEKAAAGREILAALQCNRQSREAGPAEQLLAALKGGGAGGRGGDNGLAQQRRRAGAAPRG